jgi:hypothetical protein
MAVLGQGLKIAEMAKRETVHSFFLSQR